MRVVIVGGGTVGPGDAFPMTHHMEAVAILKPAPRDA